MLLIECHLRFSRIHFLSCLACYVHIDLDDHNRVKLNEESSRDGTDYINASFIVSPRVDLCPLAEKDSFPFLANDGSTYGSVCQLPWVCLSVAMCLSVSCHVSICQLPWVCLSVAMGLSVSCHRSVCQLPWVCLSVAMGLSVSCHGSVFQLPWVCLSVAMGLSVSCHGSVCQLPWVCLSVAMGLSVSFHGLSVSCHGSVCQLQVLLWRSRLSDLL